MSSICRGGFVENAWRKDLCSNCFRTREEHGDTMTSGFYQQPSWTHQSSPSTPSVSVQVKSSTPSSTPASGSNYGLPPAPTQTKNLSANSRYQSPSVGSGLNNVGSSLNTVGSGNNPARSLGSGVGSRYGHGGGPAAIGSRINALYSDRVPLSSPRSSTSTATSGGINVTVNGTSNSNCNIKKYVQQHPAPPQPAVRTSIPSTGGNRVHTNNLPGGGVSVSVGRSTSYSSLNTVGTTATVRSNNGVGPYTSANNNSNNTVNNYGNSISNNGPTSHHYHQQRRTAHSQPPTHQHQPTYSHPSGSNNMKNSSVPVLTQSRNHLQQNSHTTQSIHDAHGPPRVKTVQVTSSGPLQLTSEDRPRAMDRTDGEVTTIRMGLRNGNYGSSMECPPTLQKSSSKGILKRDGQKRKMSVSFPQEVCAVIGYGGECNNISDEESDEEVPYDPLDNSSIPEILEKSASSPLEKELIRVTVKNTNFNSVKTNLMGFAPIEIGPIVGGTGGKSKPLVSIGTFDSRKEPLRVLRKVGGSDESSVSTTGTKNGKSSISKMVTSLGKVKQQQQSSLPASANRETEKPKTTNSAASAMDLRRNGMTQNHGIRNDNRISVPKGRGNDTLEGLLSQLKPISTSVVEKQTQGKDNQTQEHVHTQLTQRISNEGHTEVSVTSVVTSEVLQTGIVEKEGVKESGKTLETKRSSFLREIISSNAESSTLKSAAVLPGTESQASENCVDNDRLAFVSLPHDSLEPPRVIKSELKLEQSIHYHSKEQTYEDDSLEADSGLDTNPSGQTRTSETSESDTEKSGSNSDSGNENDFLEKKLIPRPGLFVSIDPHSDEVNDALMSMKPAKLSPDSVISSEMSSTSPIDSSGSNESIPQKVSEEEEQAAIAPPVPKLNNASSIPTVLKRAAPMPPVVSFPASQIVPAPHPYNSEDLYDDVHLSGNTPLQHEDATDDVEESLYDDCATVKEGKVTKGSYDFTEPGGFAPEGESVPLKQYPGIEFLGIRRIDSESFLKQASPPPELPSPTKTSAGKKDRSGSESPKPKRRVNQFFSTIGKKAGAAFRSTNTSQGGLDLSPTIKSSSMKSANDNTFSPYKRSMSTDEVSMTRTQELYATLTPTTLKLRGLTPVLNKLSKFDLKESKDDSAEKKKSKFSTSLKKFLGFGPGKMVPGAEVEADTNESPRSSPPRVTESPPRTEANSTFYTNNAANTMTRPPPPPPRVHSLDTLTKSATVSMKPARPPPPKVNQVAPSFVSVFAGLEDAQTLEEPMANDLYSPPNKPRRKASICRENDGGSGAYTANYLETTYNHITSLNFETLKLIASQAPAKIKRASNQLLKMNKSPLRWSQFYVTDVETLAYGQGYAFFPAFWEDEPCVLLLQESLGCGIAPLEFDCIEMSASFEDVVQPQFVPWEHSDFVNTGNGVRVYISVLAACTVQKLSEYVNNGSISPSRKFYALLQAMDFWGKEEMSNLVVFHKIPTSSETVEEPSSLSPNRSKSSPSPNFGLVYVVSTRIKTGSNNLLACHPAREVFESQIYELLFQINSPLLVDNDKDILQRRLEGSTTEEVEAQLRLFLQLKLFGPRSGDLDKILRYRSERQVTQWMDKERAFCMNDALKRSLERNSEPMSPLRKSFVEFLMISDNCAKTILDFIVDLYPD